MTNPPSFRLSGGFASPFLRRNADPASAPTTEEPGQIIARIQSHFGNALSPATRAELNSLARESDASLFYEGLLGLAGREEVADRLEFASALYSAIAEGAPEARLQGRARAQLDAIVGRGAVGNRAEFLLRRFAREASNPSMLVGMAGAQAVFGLTRMAILSRLAASPTTSFFTRGFGARALASTGAFMAEAPSFVAFTRGANAAMGQEQDWRLATLGREVAGSFITLGSLKVAGALSTTAFNRLHGINPLTGQATRLTGFSAISQRVLPQAAMFGGIVLGHNLETRLGIREHVDGATTMVDSLVMLLQFHVGGRLMQHAMPGVNAFNHELNMRSETLASAPRLTAEIRSQNLGSLLQPALATAGAPGEALPGRAGEGPRLPDRFFMTANGGGENGNGANGSGNGNGSGFSPPPPPVSSGPASVPPSGRRSNLLGSLIRRVQAFGGKFNLNTAMDVDAPLPPISTIRSSATPRSVQEGLRRAQAEGHNRRSLAFLRWGAHQLRSSPELQGRFMDLMQQVFEFQTRQREALDPVLRGIPEVNFAELNHLSAEYSGALERLTPGSGRHFGEAILMRELTRGWQNADILSRISDSQLREMGIEPEARHAVERNPHAFGKEELSSILDHPALRDLPETATLRNAAEAFHAKLGEVREKLGGVKTETAALRREIADVEDIEVRQTHEKRIKELATSINSPYVRATVTFQRAMREFMADDGRARAFLIGAAYHSTLLRGLQEADSGVLTRHVRDNLHRLGGETRSSAEAFLGASEQMAAVSSRTGLRRAFYSALRVFGRDPLPPLEVRGRYERALLDLVQRAPENFWEFGPHDVHLLEQAGRAQTDYYRATGETTARLREGFASVEKANEAFWERYDREANQLYVEDLNLQLLQATQMHERLNSPRDQAQFETLRSEANAAIQTFTNPSTRGANSRETNRCLEVALKKISELRRFVREGLRAENHPEANFRAVSPLMLPFVDKIDSSSGTRWRESLGAGWPLLWRTFFRSMGLFSSLERNESSSVLDRHFLNWGIGVNEATGSRLVVDPNVDRLVEAEPVVAAGNHNSWLDFLYGGTPIARAAQLQGRGSSRDAMRIGAKEGLGKMIGPVIEPAIEMLTEPVADSAPEYDGSVTNLARAMAFGDMPGERLGHRSAAVYDELTMSVASLVGPYAFDPYSPISSILNPPQGGRSFNIADRAMALTARQQNLLVTSTLNAYRLWPKPDRPLPLRRGPTVTATQFIPAMALYGAAEGKNGGIRANLLRTLWLNMGTMPEYQRGVPSIADTFGPYERPVDLSVETALAQRFAGIEELFPSAEGIRTLEAERRTLETQLRNNQGIPGQGEASTATLRDLELVNRTLDAQTRLLLRNRLTELDLRVSQAQGAGDIPAAEAKGVRRLQRVLRARLQLLDRIEGKVARGEALDRTERSFVERTGAAIAGRDNTAGIDRLVEQIDYYFQVRAQGKGLRENLLEVQRTYYDFVHNWNERRRNPEAPEYSQLHVSEADGYDAVWTNYRRALETTLNVYNVTPARWNGQIIPDIEFRREGNAIFLQPRGWDQANGRNGIGGTRSPDYRTQGEGGSSEASTVEPGREFSRLSLWRFIADDTVGIVSVAKRLREFDPTPDLYLTLHGRGWGWRMLDRTRTRIRIDNSENFRQLANGAVVLAPTHDSGAEFMTIPAVAHDYGIRAFFMADRKFFDPFPRPPAFGIIKALLGPMDQYGHLSIDRGDRRSAFAVMDQTADSITSTGRSYIIFPGSTRNPVQYNENGERYEGPIYGSKAGVAAVMERGRIPIQPLALINGGIIFPKQNGDAFLGRGAAIGRTYIFRPGTPLLYDQVVEGNPEPKGPPLRNAVTRELDRQFGELTGRPIAAPAQSKAKKSR